MCVLKHHAKVILWNVIAQCDSDECTAPHGFILHKFGAFMGECYIACEWNVQGSVRDGFIKMKCECNVRCKANM
jgi:hypothetical protein